MNTTTTLIDLIISQLTDLRQRLVEEQPIADLPEQAQVKMDKSICLACETKIGNHEKQIRGLHERCHRKLRREIAAGKITEAAAIAHGRLAPAKRGGRPATSFPFIDELAGDQVETDD